MFNPNAFPLIDKSGEIPRLIYSEQELQERLQQGSVNIVYNAPLLYSGVAVDEVLLYFLDNPNLKVYAFDKGSVLGYLLTYLNCIPIISVWVKNSTEVLLFNVSPFIIKVSDVN